ncbi:hypothetical protein ElyMa_002151000 [Elysia marginata]|uniref:Secreted protein n=1 Tax=Elysia marginata TaxID=1093978 RepID=A0AAV4FKM9_9GAST|nr:hypothetical protein ElyMa_002151000 [Elysia marginata]
MLLHVPTFCAHAAPRAGVLYSCSSTCRRSVFMLLHVQAFCVHAHPRAGVLCSCPSTCRRSVFMRPHVPAFCVVSFTKFNYTFNNELWMIMIYGR